MKWWKRPLSGCRRGLFGPGRCLPLAGWSGDLPRVLFLGGSHVWLSRQRPFLYRQTTRPRRKPGPGRKTFCSFKSIAVPLPRPCRRGSGGRAGPGAWSKLVLRCTIRYTGVPALSSPGRSSLRRAGLANRQSYGAIVVPKKTSGPVGRVRWPGPGNGMIFAHRFLKLF